MGPMRRFCSTVSPHVLRYLSPKHTCRTLILKHVRIPAVEHLAVRNGRDINFLEIHECKRCRHPECTLSSFFPKYFPHLRVLYYFSSVPYTRYEFIQFMARIASVNKCVTNIVPRRWHHVLTEMGYKFIVTPNRTIICRDRHMRSTHISKIRWKFMSYETDPENDTDGCTDDNMY